MSNAAEQLADVENISRARAAARPVYWYTIPERLAAETGVKKLGMVEITANEELMATKRCATAAQLAYELPKESLRCVNDTLVSTGDGTADSFWARQDPGMARLRQLIVTAYNSLHVAQPEEMSSFLTSKQVQVSSSKV